MARAFAGEGARGGRLRPPFRAARPGARIPLGASHRGDRRMPAAANLTGGIFPVHACVLPAACNVSPRFLPPSAPWAATGRRGKLQMADKADAKTSRCWPGFEPVPGKAEHEEGSCRKKPASKNGGKPVDHERSRKKQVAEGGQRAKQAKSKSPNASERRSVAKPAAKKAPAKRTASTKTAAKKTASKRTGAGARKKAA